MKRALVVGIDDYDVSPLAGCVNDALEIAACLSTNRDGSPNFDVITLTSMKDSVSMAKLHSSLGDLFAGEAETVLFYFAGHGIIDPIANAGYIVTQDGKKPSWGISLAEILGMANGAHPKIKSTVIILDSCKSGFAGEISGLGSEAGVSFIGNGVTILTACDRGGTAAEIGGHGAFTSILLDGLNGGAADVIGQITPASLYAHVDQVLGAWEQRPVYKANVQNFISLREVTPKVPREVIRKLPTYFPKVTGTFQLDPSFEPSRGEETERLKDILVDQKNEKIYRELQTCNRAGLVEPVSHEHMWNAAVFSGRVKLTAIGIHFCKLAELGRI